MNPNTFGHLFQVSTFGESHGKALGALIHGCPAGAFFNEDLLLKNLARRRPGQSTVTTARNEKDIPEILSGVYEGRTLGTPIAVVVRNQDQDSSSYTDKNLKLRRGHATDLWQEKFGHSDPRGSGRASGRETLSRVIGGSVAQMLLEQWHPELKVFAFVSQVGEHQMSADQILQSATDIKNATLNVDDFSVRIPSKRTDGEVRERLVQARKDGNSFGGMIDLFITGVPALLGQPVFLKLKSELSAGMMSVGAVNSVEVGFASSQRELGGKDFHHKNQAYGGLRGGISTGDDIHLRIGFKPPATIEGMAKEGRHDPCIMPRAVPVLEAMTHIVLVDQILYRRLDRC